MRRTKNLPEAVEQGWNERLEVQHLRRTKMVITLSKTHTIKEIAFILDLSEPQVVLHLRHGH